MARAHPFQVEITLSYRQHDAAGACCFVTVTETTPRGQVRVLASRHLTEPDPLRLVDQAVRLGRDASIEHYLTALEPF
jgi:hypothetical protein